MLAKTRRRKEQCLSRFISYFSTQGKSIGGVKTEIREGKFVQIKNGSNQFIVFAPTSPFTYHSHIVAKFAEDMGIMTFETDKGIEFRDTGWKIIGGGKMRVDSEARKVEVWGASQAYGQFDRTIEHELGNSVELKDYELSINS